MAAAAGQAEPALEAWIEEVVPVWFEGRIVPLTPGVCARWGALRAAREKVGRPLSMADGLIAATALEHGLTVVTRNANDFDELGVLVLNPWDARR